ncbi:MAG: type IV pilus modification PilV family protein [Geminicoccaceae bacterium]
MRCAPKFHNDPAWSKTIPEQAGFTLLEVLIALIIFSIAFGAIASIFQTSLRQSTTAETLMQATAVAERQIARYGADLPLEPGETSGQSPEGLTWNANIDLASPIPENSGIALYRITVDVGPEHGGRSYFTLETLRIGNAP